MQTKTTDLEALLFWDRLPRLTRTKSNGETRDKGSVGGQNVIRVFRGAIGAFIMVNCSCQELLRANVRSWPVAVSEDSLAVSIYLEDASSNVPTKRKYKFEFFDELAASRFFDTLASVLPRKTLRRSRKDFWLMKEGLPFVPLNDEELEAETESEDEGGNVGGRAGRRQRWGGELEGTGDHGVDKESGGGKVSEEEEEEDEDSLDLFLHLEDDGNWGESQRY